MSTSGYNNKRFIGGAGIQKELQGFAAFVAYQECHYRGLSASRATLEKSIGQQYFGVIGNDDSVGLSEQLVKGIGVFGGLYNLEDATTGHFEPSDVAAKQTVPQAFREHHQNNSVLLLKPELHCLGRHMQIVAGLSNNGITLALILQRGLSNNDHVAVRTLLFRAQEYMKNCKKALSITMSPESPYKDYTKTGNLPSGMVHDDYLKFVRLKMYDILVNSAAGVKVIALETTNNNTDDDTRDSRTMPDTWFFPGFFVFATLGPIVADESMISYRSELLMTSSPTLPPDEKTIAGQKFARKTASENHRSGKQKDEFVVAIGVSGGYGFTSGGLAKVKTEPGSASSTLTGTPSDGNEVTLHHRLVAAGIAQSKLIADRQHQSRLNNRKVVYRQNIITGKERLIEEKRFQIGASNPNNPNHATYLNDLQVMIAELSEAYDELHRLEFQLIEEQELQDETLLQMKAKAEGQGELTSNAASVAIAIDLTLASVFENTNSTTASGSSADVTRSNKRIRTNERTGDLDNTTMSDE